ncbi:hypothetical protein RJ639_001642 [Escallonia herrerae]|uniref:Nudix hydrolase domain-containing protein n=1 Tax=Escallonia herrerae TaxID=1293975 RepID=A0AA88XBD8_9ASTE|nr:hypothetical protein RJ639_001642 [Escallonia herrerae]
MNRVTLIGAKREGMLDVSASTKMSNNPQSPSPDEVDSSTRIENRSINKNIGGSNPAPSARVRVYSERHQHSGAKVDWFPMGGWENDETVEEVAVREAWDEAGVQGDLMHFLGNYSFKSKTIQDEFSPEGLCKAAMFALSVKEELECWPEQSLRQRSWLTVPEALGCCRHSWMRKALEEGFSEWHDNGMTSTMKENNHLVASLASFPDQH